MDTAGNHRRVTLGAGRCRSLGSGGHEFCGFAPGFLMRPSSQILASSNRQNVRICRAFWSSADVQRTGFFATAYYASPCALWTQACFSKSSCATRLKVSAATVLSRRGAVIPHVQWEQHQPLKSSPSIQIRCLFIHLPLRACWD